MKIFIADTDSLFVAKTSRLLTTAGFQCEACRFQINGKDRVLGYPGEKASGIAILGNGIPDTLKLAWLSQRPESFSAWPVLVVTEAGQQENILSLSEAGAGDYICLPIRPREMIMRVSLLLRKAYPAEYAAQVFRSGPFVFSRFPNRVWRDGREIALTVKEFEVARLLFEHIGQPLSRLTMEETIWHDQDNDMSRTVDTHVSRVRNKLGLKEAFGYQLQQVYGYGYQLIALG